MRKHFPFQSSHICDEEDKEEQEESVEELVSDGESDIPGPSEIQGRQKGGTGCCGHGSGCGRGRGRG